jgi:hypothetical protein
MTSSQLIEPAEGDSIARDSWRSFNSLRIQWGATTLGPEARQKADTHPFFVASAQPATPPHTKNSDQMTGNQHFATRSDAAPTGNGRSARIATRKKRQRISPKPMQLAHSVAGCVIKRYTYPLFPRLQAQGRRWSKKPKSPRADGAGPFRLRAITLFPG